MVPLDNNGMKFRDGSGFILADLQFNPSFLVIDLPFLSFFFFFFFFYLGLHLQHMEVPRLGVESEIQLPAYTTAIAT